jgi:transcriptional regulator with XRE-family HTH domain
MAGLKNPYLAKAQRLIRSRIRREVRSPVSYQDHLARALGTSQSYVSRLLARERRGTARSRQLVALLTDEEAHLLAMGWAQNEKDEGRRMKDERGTR